jgi:hypothetical protein
MKSQYSYSRDGPKHRFNQILWEKAFNTPKNALPHQTKKFKAKLSNFLCLIFVLLPHQKTGNHTKAKKNEKKKVSVVMRFLVC